VRLVMTLLVRDEVDIVRANVDFHLEYGVDFVIVTDKGSSMTYEPGGSWSTGRWRKSWRDMRAR